MLLWEGDKNNITCWQKKEQSIGHQRRSRQLGRHPWVERPEFRKRNDVLLVQLLCGVQKQSESTSVATGSWASATSCELVCLRNTRLLGQPEVIQTLLAPNPQGFHKRLDITFIHDGFLPDPTAETLQFIAEHHPDDLTSTWSSSGTFTPGHHF